MIGKRSFILLAALAAFGAYLYGANAYIYHRIAQGHLPFPDTAHVYEIGEGTAPRVYVALGDSLTAGVGTMDYHDAYPYLLAEKMATGSAIELKDLSYPGIKSADIIRDYLADAVASAPDIVTLLIGTNDIHDWVSAAAFEKNYRTILDALSSGTQAKIYVVSVPYIGSDSLYLPPLRYYFDWQTRRYNEIIRRVAAEYGAAYIDIATPTRASFRADGPLYAADSFHPSAEGYRRWADLMYADIDR